MGAREEFSGAACSTRQLNDDILDSFHTDGGAQIRADKALSLPALEDVLASFSTEPSKCPPMILDVAVVVGTPCPPLLADSMPSMDKTPRSPRSPRRPKLRRGMAFDDALVSPRLMT